MGRLCGFEVPAETPRQESRSEMQKFYVLFYPPTDSMERAESRSVRIRDRGVLTLPKSLRDKYDLGEGDALYLVDAGGAFVLTPMKPMVPSLSQKIEEIREETGLSAEELLEGLDEQRVALIRDRYGETPSESEPQNESPNTPGDGDE